MRDLDVRKALNRDVLKRHAPDSNTIIIHELGLQHGRVRVDVAVVNGILHGYELKSDSDTLDRLPNQIAVYSKVLDKATLVVGSKHAEKAKEILPKWWGIKIASEGPRGGIKLKQIKSPKMNPSIDPTSLAQLLWKTEAADILRNHGVLGKDLRKPRAFLYDIMADLLSLDDLRASVRLAMKKRKDWISNQQPL